MHKLFAILSALLLTIALTACGTDQPQMENPDATAQETTPETTAQESAPQETAPFDPIADLAAMEKPAALASVTYDDCDFFLTGIELTKDRFGADALMVTMDMANRSAKDQAMAYYTLYDMAYYLNGEKLSSAPVSYSDVPAEYSNDSPLVHPGVYVRDLHCLALPAAEGTLEWRAKDPASGEEKVFYSCDLSALPGAAPAYVQPAVTQPRWSENLAPEHDFSACAKSPKPCTIKILETEVVENEDSFAAYPILNVYYELTNNSDSPRSLEAVANADCYQDGIGLLKGYPKNEPHAELGIEEDIEPGQTAVCVYSVQLRSDSPVEVMAVCDICQAHGCGIIAPAN